MGAPPDGTIGDAAGDAAGARTFIWGGIMSDEPKKPTVPGLLIHLAFATWGIYLIAKPGSVGLFQGTMAILLIVFGIGMFLLGVVARFAKTPSEAAASMAKMERELYAPVHEKRRVDGEATIRAYGLDREFYR